MGSASIILVFLAGIISFFSPCIVPILPLYFGYLASGLDDDSSRKTKVLIRTISFVLGISVAFFLLGMLFTGLGQFFGENKTLITRISGIIIIFFGLIQTGFLNILFFKRHVNFNFLIKNNKMNTLNAFIMGFSFSFAWTPCVGPILSSVLILASSSKSVFLGNFLVLIYTLGFIIPFLVLGLMSSKILDSLKTKGKLLANISKIGGVIIIIMGIMVYTGWLNNVSSYLSQFGGLDSVITEQLNKETSTKQVEKQEKPDVTKKEEEKPKEETEVIPSVDFTLTDQNGVTHTLSDYKGKTVFLNFWATGCPPCKEEVPILEEVYNDYKDNEDLVILSVVNPGGFLESDKDFIEQFIEDNNVTYPVLFDLEGTVFGDYFINSIPTTFMITKEGNILGYVPGGMTKDMMISIIEQGLNE